MAFPGVNMTEIPGQEYAWWQAIAVQTFRQVGVYDQFSDFSQFFDVLYAHFATAEPWFVYPDTWTTLKYWRSNDVALGIVSNFDSRIHAVLPSLGIAEFFDSVTISTEVGVAKPDADVFLSALQKHNCPPTSAWHIGDSFTEDYEGAKAVGMRGIWLKRHLRQ
jgi:putative hydrolase of the HAD superfamily